MYHETKSGKVIKKKNNPEVAVVLKQMQWHGIKGTEILNL